MDVWHDEDWDASTRRVVSEWLTARAQVHASLSLAAGHLPYAVRYQVTAESLSVAAEDAFKAAQRTEAVRGRAS